MITFSHCQPREQFKPLCSKRSILHIHKQCGSDRKVIEGSPLLLCSTSASCATTLS